MKPERRLRSLPVTFSRFARLVALASVYMVKRNSSSSKCSKRLPPISHGKEVNLTLKYKNEQPPESSDDEEFKGVVQADFVFFDPKPDDFHGVKVLLQNYLDDKHWDVSGLTDLILGQPTVGSVKIEDDEDNGIYAIATVVNLGRYKDHKCIMDLKRFLLEVCQEKSIQPDMKSMLGEQARDVGLMISQRVLNLPPQLLPPLYDGLFDEISWATEDEVRWQNHYNEITRKSPIHKS